MSKTFRANKGTTVSSVRGRVELDTDFIRAEASGSSISKREIRKWRKVSHDTRTIRREPLSSIELA